MPFEDTPGTPQFWNWPAQLAETGWAVVHDIAPASLTHALLAEARALHAENALKAASVGRAEDRQLDRTVRRDRIFWISRNSPAQAQFLDLMETIRQEVNRTLFLGLFFFEAHIAVYEPGGFYARHKDAFKGARNRILSMVYYLNEDWPSDGGGELAIYADDLTAAPAALVSPTGGCMALFLSEDIPHEVLASRRNRYSIAGWFRVNDRMTAPSLQAPPSLRPPGLV